MKESAVIRAPEKLLDGTKRKSEPPSKKRRLEQKKPESPPWKKVSADGPSSFTQEGRRRSGRVNLIPQEFQSSPEKRSTRAAAQNLYQRKGSGCKRHITRFQSGQNILPVVNEPRIISQKSDSFSQPPQQRASVKLHSPKRSTRRSQLLKKEKAPPLTQIEYPQAVKPFSSAPGVSRSADAKNQGNNPTSTTVNKAKIRLRVKPLPLPVTHPGLVLLRPRKYSCLREYFEYAKNKYVNEGGLFHPDDIADYYQSNSLQDAQIILRAEKAAEPGRVLSSEKCRIYNEVEESSQFPSQYSHLDHLCRAAVGFRKLLVIEQKSHRQSAKRLAEACVEEWCRRQPKSTEQVEAELFAASQSRYRSVVKTLQLTWENVKSEINHQRLMEWKVQEQARVRKALSEAVDESQRKLQERTAYMEAEALSEEDQSEIDWVDTDDEMDLKLDWSDTEKNMPLDSSDADDDNSLNETGEDDYLTVDQLRAKYAAMPSLSEEKLTGSENPSNSAEGVNDSIPEATTTCDESDVSVDMDDDLGSSDESRNSSTDVDDENKETKETSLLGFFTQSELQSVQLGNFKLSAASNSPESTKSATENAVHLLNENERQSSIKFQLDDLLSRDDLHVNPTYTANKASSLSSEDAHRNMSVESPISPKQTNTTTTSESPGPRFHPTPLTTDISLSENESKSCLENQINANTKQGSSTQDEDQIKTSVPFLLRGTLRKYQHYGLDWLAGLYANNTNGILADEMGLGKTIQTISLLAHLACVHHEWGPHLVIVPTSVMLNWEMEFKKWCPGFKIMTYYGNIEERKKKRLGWRNKDIWNVCITSYQLVIRDQQVFKRRQWHYMILDEAHNIKNFNSQRWQTMLTFNTRARLLLTGTPLQNNLTELWSLLYFLMPSDGTNRGVGGFADLKEFQDWFKKPSEQILEHGREHMDNESRSIISKLHKILRPYLLRRLKADVEKQLPAKYEHVEYCRLSKRQRELYDGFLSRDDTKKTLASGNNLSIINCLMQLRKVCNHPDLFIDRPILTSLPMQKSAVADYEIKELLVRRYLLKEDLMKKPCVEFLNLIPTKNENLSDYVASGTNILNTQRILIDMREAQRLRAQNAHTVFDPSTIKSNLAYLEESYRWNRFEELQHCVYLNALRRQKKPIYGRRLVELLTLGTNQYNPRPKRRDQIMSWLENTSLVMRDLIKPLSVQVDEFKSTLQRFACLTPAVIAKDMTRIALTPRGLAMLRECTNSSEPDPFHEARMKLSIQFPDKRLLQYDCGKLQTLDKLLRKLQAEGHRALIFTQMTKVLDILEQFLNIHGHKYLRLDGSTKIEQRQILTDRFNNDPRILVFILSSRSGGLGINLTGADTVIFYDLDWNPAMDKQCQDRCHRIGQTRDVHIYRLVSDHTIEANILRKANQKQMLDDIVIQEGEFTTDYFNKTSARNSIDKDSFIKDGDAAANAAIERILGGSSYRKVHCEFAQAEDQEDVMAAKLAEREIAQTDAADFDESQSGATRTACNNGTSPLVDNNEADSAERVEKINENEINAWGGRIHSIDDYMLNLMSELLKNTSLELPKDRNKIKKGKDYRTQRLR